MRFLLTIPFLLARRAALRDSAVMTEATRGSGANFVALIKRAYAAGVIEIGVDISRVNRPGSPIYRPFSFRSRKIMRRAREEALQNPWVWFQLWEMGGLSIRMTHDPEIVCHAPQDDWRRFCKDRLLHLLKDHSSRQPTRCFTPFLDESEAGQ